jgi:hypothetical protein
MNMSRGFVIDGPFMVFSNGLTPWAYIKAMGFPEEDCPDFGVETHSKDGEILEMTYKPLAPEQERDYKPMFPVCTQPQTFPVMNPTTEDDVRLFLNTCNHETFLRIADDYSFWKRHAEGTAKWSNPDTCPGRHIYPVGYPCLACGIVHRTEDTPK